MARVVDPDGRFERRMRVGRLVATSLAALAALVVGVAHLNITVRRTSEVHPVKVITKRVPVPSRALITDGTLTADQCYMVKRGTRKRDVLARYGYPSDYDPQDVLLMYPLKEDHQRFCTLSFWTGKLDGVNLDLGDPNA